MREPLLFVHLITAMVLLGLPASFSRWYRSARKVDAEYATEVATRMLTYTNLHLNACIVAILVTGLGLAMIGDFFSLYTWFHAMPLVMVALALNLNLVLGNGLRRIKRKPTVENLSKLHKRLAVFMSVHHTLITATTFLMVFKPVF